MILAPVPRHRTLAEETIAHLRAQITAGAWPVGARIPTESELVERLGVARNTVREAVRALANTGLLEIRQGSGTYVVATSELAGVMQRRFADTDRAQLNELRGVLESAAAALAARRRTVADLRTLDAALARREDAWRSGHPAAFADADATFHLAVVAAAHNDVLTAIYADLREVIRGAIAAELDAVVGARPYVDHARLVEAVKAHDGGRAAAEAQAHASSWEPGRMTGVPDRPEGPA
jgi:DNA-binding FadR family transcriptional regulator